MKKLTYAIVAVLMVAAPHAFGVSITYQLTVNGCTVSCGAGPFGNIFLNEVGSAVDVTLTLAAGERFAGTGAGQALEFNIAAAAGAVSISNITANFGVGPAPATASTFGTFGYSVTCLTCQGGQAGNPAGPLSFRVSAVNGVNLSRFIANGGGYFFTADIVGANGNTGNVGAVGGAIPEPMTASLIGAGLAGMALIRRFRKN